MAVFEELNNRPERLEDPEARKAERIVRADPKKKRRKGSSSVSLKTYKRSMLFLNIGVTVAIVGIILFFAFIAIKTFIE